MIDEFDITIKKADPEPPDFKAKIIQLAQARQERADLEREYDMVIGRIKTLKNLESKLDEEIRTEALAYYQETGETNPHEAIKIKLMPRKFYDEQENLLRAVEHGEISVLKLDTAALRSKDMDWIVVEEKLVPTPNIQSKLGEYLIRSDHTENA